MTKPVHFTRIDVRQMPGFPRGGLGISSFVDGVNVVYGPNASGKTTLARAIQRLLSPEEKRNTYASITANLVVENDSYDIDFHLGKLKCTRGGQEVSIPTPVPREVGDRYVLALHELVHQEEDQDIVKRILSESMGGYDLFEAAAKLRFVRDKPSPRNTAAAKNLKNAKRDRKEAEENLIEIDREAQTINDLESQKTASVQESRQAKILEKAIDAQDKQRKLARAKAEFDSYPPAMSKMLGDESLKLLSIKETLATKLEKLAEARKMLDASESEIENAKLPESGVSSELIRTLLIRCNALEQQSREHQRLVVELRKSEESLKFALERLGPEISLDSVKSLDRGSVEKLFGYVELAEKQRIEQESYEHLITALENEPPPRFSTESLQQATNLLERCLGAHQFSPLIQKTRLAWLIAAAILTVLSISLSFVHLSWLSLLVVVLIMVLWAYWPHDVLTRTSPKELKEQLQICGISLPETWNFLNAQTTLAELRSELTAAKIWQQNQGKRSDYEQRKIKAHDKRLQIEKTVSDWANQRGIKANFVDSRIAMLASNICDAQKAGNDTLVARKELEIANRQQKETLASINAKLSTFFESESIDQAQASAKVHDLEFRRQKLDQALLAKRTAENDIQECEREISAAETAQKELFSALGITEGDEHTLQEWTSQFPLFKEAREQMHDANRDFENAVTEISGSEELLKRSTEELEQELASCRKVAAELTKVNEKLGDIRGRVDRAKKQTSLEQALDREELCLDELRKTRDQDEAEIVGKFLVDYLKSQHRDRQQPGVLKKASELFARITHGRYRLMIEPDDPPRFRAFDTTIGSEQSLDELSSSTHLLLLLSVRLAFVEKHEKEYRLPFIFDETLGNTDERRAKKIIEAAVEIAKSGRQVIYFTAQLDELGKWRRVLQEFPGVANQEFDLARLRNLQSENYAPESVELEPVRTRKIAPPNGDSWVEYGKRLNVQFIDPRNDISTVHIWYVVHDPEELFRLLRQEINNWGQLKTLIEIGSVTGLNKESMAVRRAESAASFLDQLFRMWRQGRGKPVDRQVLENSDAVSSAFIDAVAELAESCHGNASDLIAGLQDGKVSRFRSSQIEALNSFLIDQGYLDQMPALSKQQLSQNIKPFVFADCEQGLISMHAVDHLLTKLPS